MPINTTIQTRKMQATASIVPSTWNEEERTVEVEFASEKPVVRFDWDNWELYDEVLGMREDEADLSAVNDGVSILKDHRNSVDSIVGVSLKGWVEGKKARALIQFADDPENASFRSKVAAGIIRQISVGYEVLTYVRSKKNEKDKAERPVYRATKWKAREISFVAVPADETVGVRSLGTDSLEKIGERELQLRNSSNLIQTTIIDTEMPATTGTPEVEDENKRSAPNPAPAPAPTSGLTQQDLDNARTEGANAESQRQADIREGVRLAALPEEFAETLITEKVTVDAARKRIIAKFAENDPAQGIRQQGNPTIVQNGDDDKKKRRTVLATAMALRSGHMTPETIKDTELRNEAVKLRGLDSLGVARFILAERGERTETWGKEEIARRAVAPHSTSDFPELLGGIIHQVLLPAYEEVPNTWREMSRIGTVSDFRDHRMIRSWGLQNLRQVGEAEEYKNIPLVDATGEIVRVFKYGEIVSLTWEMLVNDELGAFVDISAGLGVSAARTIEDKWYDVLKSNSFGGPKMADGENLFSAAHGNLISPGTAMTATNLDAIRVKMATQKDAAGRFISFRPDTLLVNIANEATAKIYNDAAYDVDVTNKFQVPNKARGLFRQIISSPRVLGAADSVTPYYLFAKPSVEPVMQVSFLDGNQTPVIERNDEFRQDAISYKIRTVFGVNAVGWRGAVYNPGA